MRASLSYILQLERKIRIYNSANTTLKEAQIQLNNDYTRYKSIMKENQKLRNIWLQGLATRQREEEGDDAITRFTTLIHQE